MPDEPKKTSEYHVSNLITCPKCEHSNAVGTRYCDNCGASLANVEPRPKEMEASSGGRGFFSRIFGRK